MAIITGGILGKVTQKIANVVFQKWKSLNTAREKVTPANPRTPKQVFQRDRFSFITFISSLIRITIIIPFWNYLATGTTTYINEFSGENIPLQPVFVDDVTPFAPDYAVLKIGKGSLEPSPVFTSATYNTLTGDFETVYDPSHLGNGLDTDTVKIVVIDTANEIALPGSAALLTRADAGDSIGIGAARTAADLKAYLFLTRGEGDLIEVSNSQYLQVTAI